MFIKTFHNLLTDRIVGFNEVIGSWKIIAISFPRIFSISFSETLVKSRSFKNEFRPFIIFAGGWELDA